MLRQTYFSPTDRAVKICKKHGSYRGPHCINCVVGVEGTLPHTITREDIAPDSALSDRLTAIAGTITELGDNHLYVNHPSWKYPVRLQLEASLAVRDHSPGGFSWGYHGSGPAQSALAILLFFLKKDYAEHLYQDFKAQFIAKQKMDEGFVFNLDVIGWAVEAIQKDSQSLEWARQHKATGG